MRSSPKARRKTAFVPRVIFHAVAVVGVVPLCALGCGGKVLGHPEDGGTDVEFIGVGAACFDGAACEPSVAYMGFDSGDAPFGVACQSFDGGPCGPPAPDVASIGFDGGGDAPVFFDVAEAGFGADGGTKALDASFGVAADAFGGHDT